MKYGKLVFMVGLFTVPLIILGDSVSVGLTLSYRNEIVTMDFQCNSLILPISIIHQSSAKNQNLDASIKKVEKQIIISQKRELDYFDQSLQAVQFLNKNDPKLMVLQDDLKKLKDYYGS